MWVIDRTALSARRFRFFLRLSSSSLENAPFSPPPMFLLRCPENSSFVSVCRRVVGLSFFLSSRPLPVPPRYPRSSGIQRQRDSYQADFFDAHSSLVFLLSRRRFRVVPQSRRQNLECRFHAAVFLRRYLMSPESTVKLYGDSTSFNSPLTSFRFVGIHR